MRTEIKTVRRPRRSGGALLYLLAVTAAFEMNVRLAHADPAIDADVAIKNGTELRKKGKDREALAEFQRAIRLAETPRALAQLALAEQALGLWTDANRHLGRALDSRTDPWIQKNRATLETAQSTIRTHVAEVEVWGSPTGAEVQFDGVVAGVLPSVTAWLGTGDVSMTVTAPGHSPVTRLLTIPAAGRSREHVQLRPLSPIAKSTASHAVEARQPPSATVTTPPAPPIAASDTTSGAGTHGAMIGGDTTRTASKVSGPDDVAAAGPDGAVPIYQRWWFWTAVGVVAVGAGAGVYLLTRDGETCAAPPCDTF